MYFEKAQITLKTSSSFHQTFVRPAVKLYMLLQRCDCGSEVLGSPAEVEQNWDVRRGTGCWRWQIAEASRASSITPCGYTMWLPLPQETRSNFHLYKTGVVGGIDILLEYIVLLSKSKKGCTLLYVSLFYLLRTLKYMPPTTDPQRRKGYKNTWSTAMFTSRKVWKNYQVKLKL